MFRQRIRAPNVQGCLSLRTRLGQNQRAIGKIEREQPDFPWDRGTGRPPPKAAGDHEVEDKVKIALEFEHDAFAESSQAPHVLTLNG
jgi:hypothetical protein